jgi:hypothetical protein
MAKLSDDGTIINPGCKKRVYGKEYLVLQKYEEGIGKDVWYFILIQNLCHGNLPILP